MGIWEFGREPNGIYTVGRVAGVPGGKRQMTPAPLLVVRFEPASANSVGCSIEESYSVTSYPLTLIWHMVFITYSDFLSKV